LSNAVTVFGADPQGRCKLRLRDAARRNSARRFGDGTSRMAFIPLSSFLGWNA